MTHSRWGNSHFSVSRGRQLMSSARFGAGSSAGINPGLKSGYMRVGSDRSTTAGAAGLSLESLVKGVGRACLRNLFTASELVNGRLRGRSGVGLSGLVLDVALQYLGGTMPPGAFGGTIINSCGGV